MNENVVVTVVVVSYNAEDTIVETLDSIKNQNYEKIELIIADDCSHDKTVEVTNKWLLDNSHRFVRTKLVTSSVNQGVCKNLNKGHLEANGEWIMCPAADDILFPNCISDYMQYASDHPEASFITGYMSWYNEEFKPENCIFKQKGPSDLSIFKKGVQEQLKQMAYSPFVWAPTIIYKRVLYEDVGGFREEYAFEDWPFYIDVLEKGYSIHFLEKITVGYRFHQSSSHSEKKLFNYGFSLKTRPFIKERCFKYFTKSKIATVRAEWHLEDILHKLHMENDNVINAFIYKKILALLYRVGNSSINQ